MIKRFEEFFLNESSLEDVKELKEVTEETFNRMEEVLPPMYISSIDGVRVQFGFGVSEPYSATEDGKHLPTFSVYFKIGGKFYEALATLANKNGTDIKFNNYHDMGFSRGNKATSVNKPVR